MNPGPRVSVSRSGKQHGGQGSCQRLARKDFRSQRCRAPGSPCQGRSTWRGAALWCVELSCLSSGLKTASVIPLKVVNSILLSFLIRALALRMASGEFPQEPIYGWFRFADKDIFGHVCWYLGCVFLPDVSNVTYVVSLLNKSHDWLAVILVDRSDSILFYILYAILTRPMPFHWSCSPHTQLGHTTEREQEPLRA